nr:hypothetical protein Ade03nite_46470 [Actinoplanes derwentensis]
MAANQGPINWTDPNWERSYDGRRAYSQSKIAFGLFGLELDRRSRAGGWGITSNIAHPGVAPTSLLAARPEVGRPNDTAGVRLIRILSRIGLTGTVESAALPALHAAAASQARGGRFYGPAGPGGLAGAPAERPVYSRLTSEDDAVRMWKLSEELTHTAFPHPADKSSRRGQWAGDRG